MHWTVAAVPSGYSCDTELQVAVQQCGLYGQCVVKRLGTGHKDAATCPHRYMWNVNWFIQKKVPSNECIVD